MRRLLSVFIVLCLATGLSMAFAARKCQGTVVDQQGQPIVGAAVVLNTGQSLGLSDVDGNFTVTVPDQYKQVTVTCTGFNSRTVGVKEDMGTIALSRVAGMDDYYGDSEDLIFDESVLEDEEGNAQSVAALTGANDNIFYSTASYNFGPMYFKYRGLQNEYQNVYLNGVNFNDPIRGRFNFSTLMGLTSRAFRNKTTAVGMDAANFGWGGMGGAVNYNTITDTYAPGFNGSAAYTNSNYMLRAMASYATGMNEKGWALTVAAIGRYAKEGVIDGTFYNSGGFFASLEKRLNEKNSLTLTAFGGPTQRAGASATYQEVYDLVGSNLYNPNWGWQDGKKRNSRVVESFDPTFMLTWLYKDQNTTVNTSAAARWVNYSQSALQYYKALDPNPTYYRYLPSYYSGDQQSEEYELYDQLWRSKDPNFTQINWDNLYRINYLNNEQNLTLPADQQKGSSYIVEKRHSNQFQALFNTYMNHRFNSTFAMQAGVSFNYTKGSYYKTIKDLMGGAYWLDVDPFSDRDITLAPDNLQNDLDHPNRHVTKGDRFGYDYNIYYLNATAWLQNTINTAHWDVNYGMNISFTQFYRDGHMRNGRAPLNSLGKSAKQNFDNASIKAGATYKLDGRNYFRANVSYGTRAPLADQAFIAPRVKNTVVAGVESERDFAIDAAYIWNYRRFRGTISAYYINMDNVTERTGFYDDRYSTYAIYALTGVRKVNKGVELGMAYKITPSVTATFAGTFARYNYKNNPKGTRSFENGLHPDTTQTVYLKNYYMGSTPQTVFNVGIDWQAPHSWFFNINGTWQGDAYVNLSPAYHEVLPDLYSWVSDPSKNTAGVTMEEKIKELTVQDKLKDAFSLNFSIGKMVNITRSVTMNFNLNVNNVLNNKNVVTYAYQQGRVDTKNYNRTAYPNKYSYAQGIKVFFNVGIRF